MALGSVAEWVTASIAAGALYVAWTELGAVRKTASADFIHRLKDDFFTPEATSIIQLLSEKHLKFIEAVDNPYFVTANNSRFSVFEFDRHVMLPLENLGALAHRGLVDIELAYEFFAWHVDLVWENEAVRAYVGWTRSDPSDADYFCCLESLNAAFATCERTGKHTCRVQK
jgi:hypothetical protein